MVFRIFDLMRRAWHNANRIPNRYQKNFFAQRHQAGAGHDVIQLFSGLVSMEFGLATGADSCLGKTLVVIAVCVRVH